jgi:pimeloyl-ACP methyl ester carboxylesterase
VTFLLIHGAFHGGWCWTHLADHLSLKGFKVFAPSLSGMGIQKDIDPKKVSLETHIEDVCSIIVSEKLYDVVLVGHSYGGMPITGAADRIPGRIRTLVYLDAMIPENGKSALDIRYPSSHPFPTPDSSGLIPPVKACAFNLSGEKEKWVDRQLQPQPPKTVIQPIRLEGAWNQVSRKIYLRAAQYEAPWFDRFLCEKSSDPTWETYSYPWGHDMMITHPEELSKILIDFSRSRC